MRMKGLLAVAACILLLLFAGCGANEPAPEADPAPGVGDGELVEFPEAVAAMVETLRPIHAGAAVVEGDKTYFIVSDADPAAGYGVDIADIVIEGDRAVVTVHIIEPDPGAAPAELVSHPYAVEARDGAYTAVQFRHTDGEYFPRVVGLEKPLALIDRSENILVGSFASTGDRILACGLARVFEATVSFELRDEEGRVLGRGYTTAAAGGPDWGYFELKVDNPPEETAQLVLFQESAKDGSPLDQVNLPVPQKCG